jgi:hypothetical protein
MLMGAPWRAMTLASASACCSVMWYVFIVLSPCVFVLLCVVCLQRQEEEPQGEDEKDGEDFAGECEGVFHVSGR